MNKKLRRLMQPNLALFFVGTLPVLAITLTIMMRIGQPRFRKMLRFFSFIYSDLSLMN